MIIWLNGPYGVGKSTVAREIRADIENCFIFSAEAVGDAVRNNMPEIFFKETYEEFPLWHKTCVDLLDNLDSVYGGIIIVPMTLIFQESAEKIITELQNRGHRTFHIILDADEQTLHQRILSRGEDEDSWCMENRLRCLSAQKNMECDLRISTDKKTSSELAEEIIKFVK